MKYYQDPDTGNCYAVRTSGSIVGPTKDSRNAPCATLPDTELEFLEMFMTPVSKNDAISAHPRLLAYLMPDSRYQDDDPEYTE